jgi:hypothetical protein
MLAIGCDLVGIGCCHVNSIAHQSALRHPELDQLTCAKML